MVRPKPEGVASKYNAPFCAFGQDLERAAVRSTRLDSPDDFTFSHPGPLPEGRRDPRPDEVSKDKAQGLCQAPVSVLPLRYGLFRIKADKLSHLRGVPAKAGASAKDGMAEFIADPKMKTCVSNTMNSQMKFFAEFNQALSEIEVKAIDPDIQEEAQEFVKGLKEMKCPLQNDESEFLEKAVAFAMQAGISADELAEAANIIMINDGAPGIFAYKFLTIVSLDIARKFHRASKSEYSAGYYRYVESLERFDRFVETVESAIFKGDIEVGVMDLSEIVQTNNEAAAFYNNQEDKIKFRPIDKNTSFLQMIEFIVHESYHAAMTGGSEINNMNAAWGMTQKKKSDEIKKQLDSLISQLPHYRHAIYKTRIGSLESGAAVMQYLSVFNSALSLAYYHDKEIWRGLLEKNLKQRAALSELLLYVPYSFDGIGKTPGGQRK